MTTAQQHRPGLLTSSPLHPCPNLFIIGAAKSGTTSMHQHLSGHPDVFMPSLKEPHFFAELAPPRPGLQLARLTREEYLSLYAGRRERWMGDASPSYLWDEMSAPRIREAATHPRFIVLLRDPVQRAFSHYLMEVREGRESRQFAQAIADDWSRPPDAWGGESHLYRELGEYDTQLARFYSCFDSEQILVLESATLNTDPVQALSAVYEFLDVAEPPGGRLPLPTANRYARPRAPWVARAVARARAGGYGRFLPASVRRRVMTVAFDCHATRPSMDAATEARLRRHFAPHVDRTEALVGRKLASLWGDP